MTVRLLETTAQTQAGLVRYIMKRDGRKVLFYKNKIVSAVQAAVTTTGIHDNQLAATAADMATYKLNEIYADIIPTVEQVQDLVEDVLMELDQYEVAKAYILYRQERNRIRDTKSRLMKTYQGIAFEDAKNNNLKRENANVDGNTAMGAMLKYGSEGSKEFAKMYMIKPEHTHAHENGDMHIHDLDFLPMGTLTCCQIDIIELFKNGFSTGYGFLREPNDINSYCALAAIILQSNQNEQHGGQSIPNFDYAMALGVRKTFGKSLASNIEKVIRYRFNTDVSGKEIKSIIKAAKEELGQDSIKFPSLDENTIQYLTKKIAEKFNIKLTLDDINNSILEAKKDTIRATFQAMEAFIHNLNTMHSRAGAQVPFTSINFGTDTTPEGQLVIEQFLLAAWAGLGNGETPLFPISIFKVKEGINYNEGDPNYYLFKLSIKVSAKRLFPNFVFLDAPFNLQYYKPGDYTTEVVTMGCRTRVMGSVFKETDGKATSRGNISFTTINLPRLGIKHGIAHGKRFIPDMDGFYKDLDKQIDLAIEQMMERYEIQANKQVKNFPFLMGQGIWWGSNKLGSEDTLRDVIKHGTLSMGFIGLAETLVALAGKHHGESAEAQKIGMKIIKHMRKRMDEASKKFQLNFSLLATPAEGLSGRFVKIDQEKYGEIAGITDKEYYTNSFHLPVYYKVSCFDKVKIEAPYHEFCNAGHITYVELDGDPLNNLEAFESIIRLMRESGIGYGSINHPVDRDPECGYNGIIGDTCPKCGRAESKDGVQFERLRRITGYLVGTLSRWNDAKKAEEQDRIKHEKL
jgi:ribonucleoside-triphosphate reductase